MEALLRQVSEQVVGTGSEQQSEHLKSLANESCGLLLRHVWAVPLAEERPCEVIAETCTPQVYHTLRPPEIAVLSIVAWVDSRCPCGQSRSA